MRWGSPPGAAAHATDPVAECVADLHALLGEGPAADAMRLGRPVAAPDLASSAGRRTWPLFAAPAQAAGVRAVVAVPLRGGGLGIGLFGLYSRFPTVLSADQVAEVEAFAEIALGLLLDRYQPPLADVERWLAREAVLHQASGIVSVQLGVGMGEALVRLRAHAFAQGRSLLEIAREVVTRKLRFSPNTSERPNRFP